MASLLVAITPAGSQIYLHSPALEASGATASDKFPDEAVALKPFDDQLSVLADFASRENVGVARYWVDERNALFARLMAMEPRSRDEAISKAIRLRLNQLGLPADDGNIPLYSNWFVAARGANSELAVARESASIARSAYLASLSGQSKPDLSCEAVAAPGSTMPSDQALGAIWMACGSISQNTALLATISARFASGKGELATEYSDYQAATTQTVEVGSVAVSAELKKRIDEAIVAAIAGDELSKKLDTFREAVRSIAEHLSAATAFVSLSDVGDKIDKTLVDEACATKPPADRIKDAACVGYDPASTGGKIEAGWALARALVDLRRASEGTQAAAQWLIAAKAIVAAEAANAKLLVSRNSDDAAAHLGRFQTLEQEAYYLSLTYKSLSGPRGGCHDPSAGGDTGPNSHCALASYLEAWNQGRIPAGVQIYRPIQNERSYAVRQARVIAQKEHALARAAAAQLKAYGAGGVKPEVLAQLLFDIALIGTTAGN